MSARKDLAALHLHAESLLSFAESADAPIVVVDTIRRSLKDHDQDLLIQLDERYPAAVPLRLSVTRPSSIVQGLRKNSRVAD